MRIAEIMLVFHFSSLSVTVGVSFPWWMWILAVLDVFMRIADDYKEWLRNKQVSLLKDVKDLEKTRMDLYYDIRENERKSGIKARPPE